MSALTIVYGTPTPVATIEQHRTHDPDTGRVREAYVWDCYCGARGQDATVLDAKASVAGHLASHARRPVEQLAGQVTIEQVLQNIDATLAAVTPGDAR